MHKTLIQDTIQKPICQWTLLLHTVFKGKLPGLALTSLRTSYMVPELPFKLPRDRSNPAMMPMNRNDQHDTVTRGIHIT